MAHLPVCCTCLLCVRGAFCPRLREFVFAKTKTRRNAKGKCHVCPFRGCTQLTFHQDFVSRRANGRSPQKPLHTQWLCCLLCAGRRPCGSSLNLTAVCFIITEKPSRRPQTELLLPVLNRRKLPFLSVERVSLFLLFFVVFYFSHDNPAELEGAPVDEDSCHWIVTPALSTFSLSRGRNECGDTHVSDVRLCWKCTAE